MGMVLEHQLSACYAAGSLGGTLGRLNESLRRLSRAQSTGSREKPGEETTGLICVPARPAHLNQTLQLMADAWQSKQIAAQRIGRITRRIESLKENSLMALAAGRRRPNHGSEYQLLAQALDNLRADVRKWV